MKNNKVFWGDLHSHCNISYGDGKLSHAVHRASKQLDFCTITGHAFWPDISEINHLKSIKNYHLKGFQKLKKKWNKILIDLKKLEKKYIINVFPSYEWHSLKYGDHNIINKDFNLKLISADNIDTLKKNISKDSLVIPHHIGYGKNKRGINWEYFNEIKSPFVEIFSMHGLSLEEINSFKMLHDMGTLSGDGTATYGWSKGYKFGIIGSTDHHAGYPGSYGSGLIGVIAKNKKKSTLWSSLKNKNVYAVSGDKIELFFTINNKIMGTEIKKQKLNNISIYAKSLNEISHGILFKNDKKFDLFTPDNKKIKNSGTLNFEWGWGDKNKVFNWNIEIKFLKTTILEYQTCFKGIPKLSPNDSKIRKINNIALPNNLKKYRNKLFIKSKTIGNTTLKDDNTQAVKLRIRFQKNSYIILKINKKSYKIFLEDIINEGSKTIFTDKWLSQLFKVGPFSYDHLNFLKYRKDKIKMKNNDRYRVEIIQKNNHRAWSSPIWIKN